VASAQAAGRVPPMSDREATRRAQDAANNAWLLDRLQGGADRRARFVSTLVALRSADDPEPLIAFGRWEGLILEAPQGEGGFGYDPLMFVPALGATVAMLPAEVKNAHSHRALAAAQMRALMRDAWGL
jgi:XTP/dITP diphosphohydrolase